MMIRRDFMKSSVLAAGALVAPHSLFSKEQKIKLAILGTGWWGTDYLLGYAMISNQFDIVALCDVNEVALQKAANKVTEAGNPKPKLFASYQEMYQMPGLEAVAIATPTYWHALQFIEACDQGLHVFLEKPISYDIREGQAMVKAHQKAKNVVQVDFPRMMADINDQVKSYIQSGEAGKILQVRANIHNPEGPLVEKAIPDTMDYDSYCGPAPKQPYLCNPNNDYPNWRGQHDFSRGIMVDWGIHYLHNVRYVMDLNLPAKVSAFGGTVKNFTTDNPDHLDVRYDFEELPVYWSHKTWGYASPTPEHDIGIYYYGEKATIFAGDSGWEVYPKGGDKIPHGKVAFDPVSPADAETYSQIMVDMFVEFANGVRRKSNQGITNQLDQAYKTTSMVNYGDMAFRANSEIVIDAATMDIMNNQQASELLKRPYRSPYEHPYI
jgi:predicted dehydrogenase